MPFFSVYLTQGRIEIHPLEQEHLPALREARLVSTHKQYESALEFAGLLAQEKQLPVIDCTQLEQEIMTQPAGQQTEIALIQGDQSPIG